MNDTPNPGEITRGLTEYVFSCWSCGCREVIHAANKPAAIVLAKHVGWFTKRQNWYCVDHNHKMDGNK
jgi:hypothetical protein